MKQPARVSPFAARTSQEQKEQWIVWQSQRDATRPVTAPPAPLHTPRLEMERPAAPARPQPVHHSQYDAVVKRIAMAQRRASAFVDARQAPESTRQPGSGSE